MSKRKSNPIVPTPSRFDKLTIFSVLVVAISYVAFFSQMDFVEIFIRSVFVLFGIFVAEFFATSQLFRIQFQINLCEEHGVDQGYVLWQLIRSLYVLVELAFVALMFTSDGVYAFVNPSLIFPPALIIAVTIAVLQGVVSALRVMIPLRHYFLDMFGRRIGSNDQGTLYIFEDKDDKSFFYSVKGPWRIDGHSGLVKYRWSYHVQNAEQECSIYRVCYVPKKLNKKSARSR